MPKKQVITKSALVPTILISGGAGFIGSHLAEALLDNNARVIVLDNFQTGKKIHVKNLLSNKKFALYDVDINEGIPPEIESVDYIFHLAGVEEYLYSKDYLNLESLFTNSLGTKNLLDLARRSSAKFLLVSTIDVYQGRMSQLYLDKYFGITPSEENKFSLIEAKRFAEAVVWEYFKTHGADVRIVRIPEVYGPRMDLSSSGFLGGFIKNVLDGSSIEIYGEGTEKEYYLYVSDVVSGLVKAQFNSKTKGNIYSLIPKDPVSALEIAYMIKSLADAKLSVQFKPGITDFKQQLKSPDTFNLKDLGWKSKVGLKEGVIRTLEDFGYSVNTHAFKPIKLVEEKIKESTKESKEKVTSLQGIVREKEKASEKKLKEPVNFFRKYKESPIKVLRKEVKNEVTQIGKKNIFSGLEDKLRSFKYRLKGDFGYVPSVLAVIVAAALVFIAFPVLSFLFSSQRAVLSLEKAKVAVSKMDSLSLKKEALLAADGFNSARKSLRRVGWVFSITKKTNYLSSYDKLLGSTESFSRSLYSASVAIKPLENTLGVLRPDTQEVLNADSFIEAKFGISEAKNHLSLAEADFSGVDKSLFPEKIITKLSEYEKATALARELFDSGYTLISELPQILGIDSEKKYVFWFQNSSEMRPTGGFIGSYGVLTLDKGKIKNFVIDDIYNPDGQIDLRKIAVTPPEQIKNFLKENVLYLRNSNWDPDFPKSTKAFDDLYFKITGETINGYLAVDLDFVKSLLKVTGPLYLASYNEDISAENFYERAQYYSGFDYKEGSSDKKSFLTILGSKLMERLFALKSESYSPLLSQIGKSLDERHLMIYFTNNVVDKLLKEKRWDGSLVDTPGDYLFIVNANLGGTKANYYVENKMTYEVSALTRDGLLRANLYLDYKHTADDNAWPGGPYTDYVRAITQNGSKLTGAKISYNGGVESDIFKGITVSKEGAYNSFETSFKINPGESVRLILSYDLPVNLSITKDQNQYSLVWQKQAGTGSDAYVFSFSPPFGTIVEAKSSSLSESGKLLESRGIFQKDLSFLVLLR